MEETLLKSALGTITNFLRYIASGFVGFGIFILLNENITINSFDKSPWLYVFFSAAIGLFSYAFHAASFDNFFYRLSAYEEYINYKKDDLPVEFDEKFKQHHDKITKKICFIKFRERLERQRYRRDFKKALIFELKSQTLLRTISQNPSIAAIQGELSKKLALLCFLFCSIYLIISISAYHVIKEFWRFKGIQKISFFNNFLASSQVSLMMIIGLLAILVWVTLAYNEELCKRELWVVTNFYQKNPEIKLKRSFLGNLMQHIFKR